MAVAAQVAGAHCQIPCGIYGDGTRIDLLDEHISTVEKSMKKVVEISRLQKPDNNQLVRWVLNKERHVEEINEIITSYFLAQRVKLLDPDDKKASTAYVEKLKVLHEMLVSAMKAKQTTDQAHVVRLRVLLKRFEKLRGFDTYQT